MDAVLVTGDIFDTGATPSDARELFSDLVVKLHRAGVALLLGGSHVEAMKERIDPLVVALLNRLASTQLSEHFRVVGTHALYAYEAAAGCGLRLTHWPRVTSICCGTPANASSSPPSSPG